MTLKKTIRVVHLWLGLISGLLVFIIAITGCIYAFQDEIQRATQSYRYVKPETNPMLPPSALEKIANNALPNKHLHAIMYHKPDEAAKAIFYSFEEHYYYFVYINPYRGEVLKVKDEFADFFRIVLDGHFYLWLPPAIGQPIVASATLVFFVLLVSGIILWWPKNNKNVSKKFTIRWSANWRRKNYDLHSVLGFYICWLALVFVVTGLVWGFTWFRNGLYSITSGGKQFIEYYAPASDTTQQSHIEIPAIDRVWYLMKNEYPNAAWIEVHPPEDNVTSIAANANPDAGTYWKTDYRYFDQYSLQELPVDHVWNRLHQSTTAELIMRMNYDIHVGAVLGLPGKILAFLISLTIASLPVTGCLVWYGRKKKQKEKQFVLKTITT